MSSHNIPIAMLPVSVKDKHGFTHTERFSQQFGDKLSNRLLMEFGAVFEDTDGHALAVVNGCEREICEFCLFLTNTPNPNKIHSLNNLNLTIFNDYINHLKRKHPTKHTNGRTTHPWKRKWGALHARLRKSIPKEKFPYITEQARNTTDGHTPYAMGLMLDALRSEIDRIREKLHVAGDGTVSLKWFELAKRGRVFDHDMLKAYVPGKTSMFTREQLDTLEKAFFEPDGRSHDQLAKDFSMTISELYTLKQKWVAKGRENGRPTPKLTYDDVDLKIEDIIATISYYLPNWPVSGWVLLSGTNYRVYRSEAGILHGIYTDEKEAITVANAIGGVVVTTNRMTNHPRNKITNNRLNPAEIIIIYSGQKAGQPGIYNFLGQKLRELLPGGFRSLRDNYFPTTYDWTIILLYWIVLTGWNLEAIRSVNRLDVLRQIKKGGTNDLLSKVHATFTAEIDQRYEENVAELTGEKLRGQPEGRPKLFTHVSDRSEPYGLFRVIEDYYKLTEPFVKYLSCEDVNRLLFGFSRAQQTVFSIFTRHLTFVSSKPSNKFPSFNNNHIHNINTFLERNLIFEDENHTQRIMHTTARQLRVTYFTTLRSLNVPITTLAFLAGHESIDTHLVHYSSGQHGTKILREKSRRLLNVVADKAFSGTLTRYTQTAKKHHPSTIIAFTHRNNPFMLCANPYSPSWPNNEDYLAKRSNGMPSTACDHFEMCLMCNQCQVTEDTLPFLVRWLSDLHEWRRAHGGGNFPYFMHRRYQAIQEVFELCESDEYWRAKLRNAEVIAETDEFDAPPIWRSV